MSYPRYLLARIKNIFFKTTKIELLVSLISSNSIFISNYII